MAITGRFLADFSDFMTAVQKADVALKGMETGAGDVTKMLNKMTDSFSGRKIVQEASLMAQTFENLASQGIGLTTKELAKMGAVAEEAIAKLKAGGEAIPAGIQKIADAAKASTAAMKALDDQAQSVQKHFAAFSGDQIIAEAHAVAQAVEKIGGASKLTAAEQEKVNKTVTEAIAKYTALGQTAPKALQNLAAATKAVAGPMSSLQDQLKGIQQHVSTFSGDKIIQEASQIASAVKEIGGASKLTEKEMASVNATVTEAINKYKALGQTAPKAMTDLAAATAGAGKPTSLLAKTMGDLGTQLKATALGFISAQAIIGGVSAAFNALTGFISSSIDAFANAEAASKRVEAALLAQGHAAPELAAQYAELATAFETTTGFADDLIQEMQALFIQVGDVGPAQMEDALQAATDLAAGMGIDLKTATIAVSKAFQGNADALKKYGVEVDAAALATEGMSAVLDEINDKFGGQAIAAMQTYAGRVKAMANAWDNLKEAVGGAIANNDVVIAAMRELTEALNKQNEAAKDSGDGAASWAERWNAAILSMFPGTSAWIRLQQQAKEANEAFIESLRAASVKPPEGFGTSTLDVGGITAEMKLMDEIAGRLKQTQRTISDLHKSMIRDMDALGDSTAEIAQAMAKLGVSIPEPAIKAYLDSVRDATKATEDFAKAQEKAASDALAHTAAQIADAFNELVKALQDYEKNIVKASNTTTIKVEEMGTVYKNFGKDVAAIIHRLGVIKAPTIELPHIPFIDFDFIFKGLEKIEQQTKKANAASKEFAQSLSGMAQALTNLGKVSGGFGKIAQDLAVLVNAMATANTAADAMKSGLANLGKAGQMGNALLEIGAAATTMASAFLQATETGTAMQKTLKGAALGASIGKQWGPWGAAIGAAAGALAGFIRSLNAARNAVKDFAKSFGGFDELRAQLRILGDEGERLWKKFTQASGSPEQAAATAKEITKALGAVPQKLNEMVAAAVKAGGGLELAMVPYIESLIEAGQLTEENKNLLLGLPAAGVPSFNDVSAAAEALGLNIDTIGESIKQLKFTDTAETLAKNLDILSRAGADMDAVLNGVKDQLQALVSDALKFGRTLPESLRPFLQQLVGSGKLTDEFGNQLTDLGSLDFAKPLEDSIADLIVAMHELVDVIVQDVGGALDDISRKVVRPKIQPEFVPAAGGPGPTAPPDLSGGEAAIREAGLAPPPPAELTVIMEIDGRTAASAVVPYMPGEAKRFVAT